MTVIDLTLMIDKDMPGVEMSPARQLARDGWNATTLSLYSHCGTHMDAPCHFLRDGATLDKQHLEQTMGPAIVVDLTPVLPRQQHVVSDLKAVESIVQPGDRLLLRTDWHKQYGTAEYRNDLPRVSVELAEWLVEKQVALLGVEGPSVANVNDLDELTRVHEILFRGGVVIVEGLAHLDRIPESRVHFIALPLKIRGGDGSPVRAVAITS